MTIFWGILLGCFILVLFSLPTVLCAKLLRGRDFALMASVTLLVWLVKIVLLIVIFTLLHSLTFFNHQVFAITALLGALVITILEVLHFRKTANTQINT
jgi:hypothetical protein